MDPQVTTRREMPPFTTMRIAEYSEFPEFPELPDDAAPPVLQGLLDRTTTQESSYLRG